MSSLKLPEPIKVSKLIANQLDELEKKGETIVAMCGYQNIEAIFYLHLIKKYKSKCVSKKIRHFDNFDDLLGISISMKIRLTKEEDAKMNENFVDLAKTLTRCIKKGEETILIPLNYCCRKTNGHTNVLIYRRRTNVIEHFEPHGSVIKLGEKNEEKIQENLEKRIRNFIGIFNVELKKNNIHEVSYVEAISVCPYLHGLQILENKSLLKKSKNEPGGYCAVWSMFFADLCLKNPDKSSKEILENIYNYLTTKASAENYLRRVIRGYSGYIVECVNTYLKIFFKPTYTVVDVIGFSGSATNNYLILRDVLILLIELESEILLDYDYDLKADLNSVKKMYKTAIKGMTLKEQRAARKQNKDLRHLYYRTRILQNYEEYSNSGDISEAIVDSPLEIMQESMTDHHFLMKSKQ